MPEARVRGFFALQMDLAKAVQRRKSEDTPLDLGKQLRVTGRRGTERASPFAPIRDAMATWGEPRPFHVSLGRAIARPVMDVADLLGRSARLEILRVAGPGAFLAVSKDRGAQAAAVLLPGTELPDAAAAGDTLDVFIHLDSEGRPIATLRAPKLELGQVAFLRVTACTPFGAFVDWGPQKELLVPFAQQTRQLKPGDVEPIGLYLDASGRLAGTMRVTEMLAPRATQLELDEWVDGEAWRSDPAIGLFVIVERRCVGLVPRHEPHTLARGQAARFRVSNLFDDGKLELSLRGHALDEMASDAHRVLERLLEPRPPRVGDSSSPEEIRRLFGLSKKAFKRAVGSLLKQGRIRLDSGPARHCVALLPSRSGPPRPHHDLAPPLRTRIHSRAPRAADPRNRTR